MAFNLATVVRQYGDPYEEARICRTSCALFDFSFVGRVRLHGPTALAAIAQLTRRPLGALAPGRIRYAVRENATGHLVSDLTIWRHDDYYDVMSGRAEDIADLISAAPRDAGAQDLSGAYAVFAVQGPGSLAALAAHTDFPTISALSYFAFAQVQIDGVPALIGRLGYTGEPGFEIVLPHAARQQIWSRLARSVRPAGFVAADVLRIEAGFVLFANEFLVPVTAREAGLERFAGGRTLSSDQDIQLVCFRANMHSRPVLWQPVRPLARPTAGTITITSACHSVAAGGTLGLGFARRADVLTGAPLHDPHGTFADICLVPLPFLDPHKLRPRAVWGQLDHRP
jgi:aminomethyltransferase